MTDRSTTTDVLIVGGGPVGLALACELGFHGIDCTLVERGDGTVKTPKMNEVNTRSMEFCRRWGIVDSVLETPFPEDWPKDVVFVTTMDGYELGRVARPPGRVRASEFSPESLQICSQHWFDPILREFAESLPSVTLRYGRKLDAFEETADGVTATLADGERIAATYLVGCDGAGSIVRRALDIPLEGEGTLGTAINMFFRTSDLLADCGKDPGTFFIPVDEDGAWCNIRVVEPQTGLWRMMINEADDDTTAETVDRAAYLRRGVGRDLDVDWVDVNIWRRQSVLAASYGRGRVFLAGDAVHQVSPTGAMGMNTGLGDAVDLGWKLAAVLQGWGGDALLDSYDAERRPVGGRAVQFATSFHFLQFGWGDGLGRLEEDGESAATLRKEVGAMLIDHVGREFRTIGLQLGYRYENSPICVPDGTDPVGDPPDTVIPSARPGARAPHAWLAEGRSTLDLFGKGFTLLNFGAAGTADIEAAAADCGLPLYVESVDSTVARDLYDRDLVLVRPDGHVAWRGDEVEDARAILDRVRGAG
ncbi:MAG: FAD-dependent monooxygenase [Alphaproteobacteria bacterium]